MLGVDPLSGHQIVAKEGRFGPYVTEILPADDDDDGDKERVASAHHPGRTHAA